MSDQRAGVAGGQPAVLQQRLHRRRQPQQAQSVGEMAAALADGVRHLLLGVAEPLDQLAVAGRLLDGIEIRALHVLDQGELGGFRVAELAHDHRHGVQAGLLGCPPAALAGDDLEAAAGAIGPGDDRLQQTLLADRIGQVDELEVIERLARVMAARVQLVEGQQPLLAVGGKPRVRLGRLADERGEPTAQSALLDGYRHGGSPGFEDVRHWAGRSDQAARRWRSRSMISCASLM